MRDFFEGRIATQIAALPAGEHELAFDIDGFSVCAKLRREKGTLPLVVMFHGAVDQKFRTPPVFVGFIPSLFGKAHQIAIADPSIRAGSPVRLAWYAGEDGFPSQDIVADLISGVAAALGASRRVYFGTSGGGFAALYFSHRDAGSFVIAGNPQVKIENYTSSSVITRYRLSCWPKLAKNDGINQVTCADLTALYGQGYANTVIYVQTSGDRPHVENHMLPFLAAINGAPEGKSRLLLHSDFWGSLGHVTAPKEYVSWIHAVCDSNDSSVSDILTTWYAAQPTNPAARQATATAKPAVTPKSPSAGFSDADLRVAAQLKAWFAEQEGSYDQSL